MSRRDSYHKALTLTVYFASAEKKKKKKNTKRNPKTKQKEGRSFVLVAGGMSGLQNMMRQFQQGAAGKFGNMFGGMGGEK